MIYSTHNDILLYIATRIRKIRTELGLAIRELADKVGISYPTMQKIETDKISPPVTLPSVTDLLLLYPLIPLIRFRKKQEEEQVCARPKSACARQAVATHFS